MRVALGLLVLLTVTPAIAATTADTLTGTWRSAPEDTPLSSPFDESVWGKNAKAVRTVELTVQATGDATLTVTHKVLDGRGHAVSSATTIEHVELSVGAVEHSNDLRADHAVTIKRAERRYPDDPSGTWPLDGVKVTVSTFVNDPSAIEVRVDTPEGRGSFWETLHRSGAARTAVPAKQTHRVP